MSKITYEITGIGPLKADGGVEIFTTRPQPFTLSAAQLAGFPSYPQPGDTLAFDEAGDVTLEPHETANQEPQKKTEEPVISGEELKPVLYRYKANPIEVDAYPIVSVGKRGKDGMPIALENGTNYNATPDMLARMIPVVGDYLVLQADGYVYLNPKDVFEHKYSPVMK